MSKSKTIFNIVVLVILVLSFSFGLVTIFLKDHYNNNNVSFRVDGNNVYYTAECNISYSKDIFTGINHNSMTYSSKGIEGQGEKTFSYTEEDYFNGNRNKVQDWRMPDFNFVEDQENPENSIRTYRLQIIIKNLTGTRNSEGGMSSIVPLGVRVFGIGLDTQEDPIIETRVECSAYRAYINNKLTDISGVKVPEDTDKFTVQNGMISLNDKMFIDFYELELTVYFIRHKNLGEISIANDIQVHMEPMY